MHAEDDLRNTEKGDLIFMNWWFLYFGRGRFLKVYDVHEILI
jgi:hypothetical protein